MRHREVGGAQEVPSAVEDRVIPRFQPCDAIRDAAGRDEFARRQEADGVGEHGGRPPECYRDGLSVRAGDCATVEQWGVTPRIAVRIVPTDGECADARVELFHADEAGEPRGRRHFGDDRCRFSSAGGRGGGEMRAGEPRGGRVTDDEVAAEVAGAVEDGDGLFKGDVVQGKPWVDDERERLPGMLKGRGVTGRVADARRSLRGHVEPRRDELPIEVGGLIRVRDVDDDGGARLRCNGRGGCRCRSRTDGDVGRCYWRGRAVPIAGNE